MKPRQIVFRVLQKSGPGVDFIETLLEQELSEHQYLEAIDRRLIQELVYGVIRWQMTLDWLIDRKSNSGKRNRLSMWLLRLGLYQLFWLDRIPAYAAVNETVEMAKQCGLSSQSAFINAVLRGYGREWEATKKMLADLQTRNPSLGYSHPDWLCQRWKIRWGQAALLRLLTWNNAPPSVYARVNTLKTNYIDLCQRWQAEQVHFREFIPNQNRFFESNLVYELQDPGSIARLPSFQAGLFYVQDPSTLLAVDLLNPQPGQRILDWCSAPGGKTTFIAQRLNNTGQILAIEPHGMRLARLQQNCQRLGATCLSYAQNLANAIQLPGDPGFDGVLVDAPCSNTGVLRRRIELRWRLRMEELARLRQTQIDLLRQAAPQVKRGGVLVYSTCSIEPEENQETVRVFLSEHPGFDLETERQLLPFEDGMDGAYVARFRCKEEKQPCQA